jgi:hypothetical protein
LKISYLPIRSFIDFEPENKLGSLAFFPGMARAALVVGRIIMGSHVNDCSRLNGLIAILQKEWVILPGDDLKITGYINRPLPIVAAQGPMDNIINFDRFSIDINLPG